MSTERALRRSRLRKSGSQAPAGGLPSLPNGMRGLNHLAGNQAMAALIARRPAKEAYKPKTLHDEEIEGEAEIAALRLTLDRFAELMDALEKARDGGRGGYGDLRAWILEAIERLHVALETTEDYDGELADLLDDLDRLPKEPGQNRLEVLSQLAQKLQADAESVYAKLSKQLPAPGSPHPKPLMGERPAKQLADNLKRAAVKAKKEADADIEPAAMAALAGGGAFTLGRRRKKTKKKRR